MSGKTEVIDYSEFVKRQEESPVPIPILKAKAIVNVIDKDGNQKSTLEFTSEEIDADS